MHVSSVAVAQASIEGQGDRPCSECNGQPALVAWGTVGRRPCSSYLLAGLT